MTKDQMLALARQRMAAGGKTCVPLGDAAKICDVPPHTLYTWVSRGLVDRQPRGPKSPARAVIVDLGQVLTARERSRYLKPPGSPLSYQQIAIMRLVAAGHTNAEIGRMRGRSEHAVAEALKTIFAALGAKTRTDATVICLRLELFRLNEIPTAEDV